MRGPATGVSTTAMKHTFFVSTVVTLTAAGLSLALLFGPDATRSPAQLGAEPTEVHQGETADIESPMSAVSLREPIVQRAAVESQLLQLSSARPGYVTAIVLGPSGEPIQGALCQILRGSVPVGLSAALSRRTPARDVIASGRSDRDGRIELGVPEGFWILRAQAEGLTPWEEDFLRGGDFRWIRLGPARSLTVVVRDEEDHAVSRASVRLLRGEYVDPETAELVTATDGSGAARLESIPAGTWYVRVSHPDHVGTVAKLEADADNARVQSVVLQRGIRIAGTVLVGERAPTRAARVVFDTPDGFTSSHEVSVGADGAYASRVVFRANQTLEVAAQVAGYGETRKELSLGDPPTSGELRVDFALDSRERFAVGRVVDPDGNPLEGVEVYVQPLLSLPPETVVAIPSEAEILAGHLPDLSAYDPEPSKIARSRRACASDGEGRFRVSGLHSVKSYSLLLVSDAHANAVLWVEKGEPGGTTDCGTVRLGPAGRVFGSVRRPDGSPIEGLLVYTTGYVNRVVTPSSEFRTVRPRVRASLLDAITSADGLFAFEPFPEAEFQLMCNGTLFGPYSLAAGETLGPLELVTEDLPSDGAERSIAIRLMIVDETDAVVPSPYVQVMRVRDPEDATTWSLDDWVAGIGDELGQVELFVPEAGTYEIEVRDPRGQLSDQSFVVDLAEDGYFETVTLAPDPDPSRPLAGVVTGSRGEPLADLEVLLFPSAGEVSCNCWKVSARTDGSGAFSFGPFMDGNHRIVVTDPKERFAPAHHYPAHSGDPLLVVMGE